MHAELTKSSEEANESDRRRGRTEQDGYQDDDWSDTEREDPGEQYSFVCAFQVKGCTLQY